MNIKSLQDSKEVDIIMITRLKVYVIQIINIFSSFVLNKLTNFEKHTSKSKEISSNISKYFWLNFLIQITVLFHSKCLLVFSYYDIENYYILSKTIILNMIYSILTSQISQIFFYFWNLLKRFGDSKYNNGKTTKLTDKKKYEKIYLGPEFPFAEKYAKILVNLFVCLLFGVNSPVLNFFFACFLIVTFLVDKFLIINYYKKPLFYGEFLSKTLISFFFFGVFLFIAGLLYHISNPYLFNNDMLYKILKQGYYHVDYTEKTISYILNPFGLFYSVYFLFSRENSTNLNRIFYYNYNPICFIYIIIFIVFFINPTSKLKKIFKPKDKLSSF